MSKLSSVSVGIISVLIFLMCVWLLAQDNQIRNTDNPAQIVLHGSVIVEDNEVKILSNSLWGRGGKSQGVKFAEIEKGTVIIVDVINCAGFIGSAKAVYNDELTYWQLEIIPETVASDAIDKVKQCLQYPDLDFISTSAFAVAPVDEKRRQIKLNKLAKPSIYSLPLGVQMWANKDGIGIWADTDGDGAVDLLTVGGKCGTSEDYICSRTLSWTGLRWIEIAYSAPA